MIAESPVPVDTIAPLEHDEAMRLATTEWDRLLGVVDRLQGDDWSRPTDCAEWDVRAILGHLLGALKLQADPAERTRVLTDAAAVAAATGIRRLDAMTALQVEMHADLSTDALRERLREWVPRGLAARRDTTPEMRATPYDPQIPGETGWTMGYLSDVIHTRDPWIHRVDICRAVGAELELTADHDGRIVEDVVAQWARRHGQPFTLRLSGPAGGHYSASRQGATLEVDAVEFCRMLSGRAHGEGLLATQLMF